MVRSLRSAAALVIILTSALTAQTSRSGGQGSRNGDVLPFDATESTLPNGLKVIVLPTGFPNLGSLRIAVQAGSRLRDTPARVRQLLSHPAFDLKVPNKVYALIRIFSGNHVRFHSADGGGYAFLADQIIALNALNPQVAARMARGFDRWKKFDARRQAKARQQLERIRDADGLSKDVAEIVSKALA